MKICKLRCLSGWVTRMRGSPNVRTTSSRRITPKDRGNPEFIPTPLLSYPNGSKGLSRGNPIDRGSLP